MPEHASPPDPAPAKGVSLRSLLTENGWAMAVLAVATMGIGLGAFLLARGSDAVGAALAASVVWVALACPLTSSAPRDVWGALLRGGTVVDASAVTLLCLWVFARGSAGDPYVTFAAAAKAYCVLLGVGLAGIAGARLGTTPPSRCAWAIVTAAVLLAATATPFWAGGLLLALPRAAQDRAAAWAVTINPFYAVTSTIAPETKFAWNEARLMYRITVIGEDIPAPSGKWQATSLLWVGVAILLAATHLVRSRRRSEFS